MKELLEKINCRDFQRVALLNADSKFRKQFAAALKSVTIDSEIDPRFLYCFIMVYVKNIAELEQVAPAIIHNLADDGDLWVCYPKKTSKNFKSDLSKKTGWDSLNDSGFYGRRVITVNDDWSALKFKHIKYIKQKKATVNADSQD